MSGFHQRLAVANDLSALVQVRQLVARSVAEGGFDARSLNRMQIAVDEAVTNIIEHGYSATPRGVARIELALDVTPTEFRIEIVDQGARFDPTSTAEIDIRRHVDSGRGGGLGVFLMRSIMDVVDYHSEGRFNRLVLIKRS
jgi:anti-sigma regulatory factor (Ser/Thr protein kinase)